MTPWEEQSRVRRLGDRHDLETLPGFWFRPQKYSVEGDEAVSLAQLRQMDRFKATAIHKILGKLKTNPGGINVEDVLQNLDEEDLSAILEESSEAPAGAQTEYKRQVLLHGIGEHSFNNEKGDQEIINEDFVNRLLQDRDTTDEMVAVIVGWNRPLASGSALKSRMSSSGGAEDRSQKKAKSTQTEPFPAS